MSHSVTLTNIEMCAAVMVGCKRRAESVQRGLRDRHGTSLKSDAEQWGVNVVGALGEAAFAKFLGVHWDATCNAGSKEPDIQPDWQVRCLSRHDYDLIVRPDERDDQRFVLLTGAGPEFLVHGWVWGRDAKRPDWLSDKGGRNSPAYWVPQANLHGFSAEEVAA